MSTNSSGSAIARENCDSRPQQVPASERSVSIGSVESMRAVLAARIEHLPGPLIRNMFHQLHGAGKRHAVDFRVSIRLPLLARFYVNFAGGREQRNPDRLSDEGLTASSRLAAFYGMITFALIGYCLFGIFCFLYLLKSVLKLNIFAGQSPLHPLYELFVA